MNHERFPEIFDMVRVTIGYAEYYGFIIDIDYDMRDPTVRVEFYRGCEDNFSFKDITIIEVPEPMELKRGT